MGNTNYRSFIFRRLPLFIGLVGGLGGIFPDFDHFLRFASGGAYSSLLFHQWGVVFGAILLIGGLIALYRR